MSFLKKFESKDKQHKLNKKKIGNNKSYFRWLDSGDLQSIYMLGDIADIAIHTSNIIHWLPTKEYKFVKKYVQLAMLIPKNLFIKKSMPKIKQEVVTIIKHSQISYTTVGANNTEYECPAPKQDNKCMNCRMCWSNSNINYFLH